MPGWGWALPLLLAAAAGTEPRGTVAPEIRLEGRPAPDGSCRFTLRSLGTPPASPAESPEAEELEIAPGEYALRVECKSGSDTLIAVLAPLSVKAGKTAAPKVDLRGSRIRVMSRRDGAMRPATVRLFPAGAELTDPLYSAPSNQKFIVAAGRYDALVELAGDRPGPKPTLRIPGLRADPDKLTEVVADLSDGAVKVAATENGRRAEAIVRAAPPTEPANTVAEGEANQAPLVLAPGRWLIETTLRAAADLAHRRREVWVEAGKTAAFAEAFDSGTLTVAATRDGRAHEALVRVALPGAADFFTYFTAPGSTVLSPGKYDVLIEPGGADKLRSEKRRNILVEKKRDRKIVFDLTPAQVVVAAQRDKHAVESVELSVLEAGGGAAAKAAEADGSYRLWPGRYEIVARLPDGAEARDGPFEVGYGEKLRRVIEFSLGTLTVTPLRGGAVAAEAEVFVYRPGASAPASKARAQAVIDLAPGVYDVKVVAGSETQWQEGVRVREGKNTSLKIALAAGKGPKAGETALPEGDLPPQGDDLPEGDTPPDAGAVRRDATPR
jgi:hypothetical protein